LLTKQFGNILFFTIFLIHTPDFMKHLFIVTFCIVFTSLVFAQDKPVIVSVDWLKEHKQNADLVLVHVGFFRPSYQDEHIEGAQFLWPDWLAYDTPDASMNPVNNKDAKKIIESLGISNNSHIVLYNSTPGEATITFRMFLTLEYFGLKGNVSILNGGLAAWKKAGHATTSVVSTAKAGKFTPKVNALIVDKDYLVKNLENKSVTVIDARATRFYDGEPITGYARAGHIKGAQNIPFADLMDETSTFKSTEEIGALFNKVASKEKELVTYCFIGQTASTVYVAGRALGYTIKLYNGSMQEWNRLKELPMEVTEKK